MTIKIPRRITPKNAPQLIRALKREHAILEAHSALVRAEARRRIVSIARDLLPQAAGYARKGRPRLLAVVSKIIGDEKLRSVHELKA
jgi:hypothetical protein